MSSQRKRPKSSRRRFTHWNSYPINTILTLAVSLGFLAISHSDINNRNRGGGLAAVMAVVALWNTIFGLLFVKHIIRDQIKPGAIILRYMDLFIALTLSYGGIYTVGYILDASPGRAQQIANETEISGVYGIYFNNLFP